MTRQLKKFCQSRSLDHEMKKFHIMSSRQINCLAGKCWWIKFLFQKKNGQLKIAVKWSSLPVTQCLYCEMELAWHEIDVCAGNRTSRDWILTELIFCQQWNWSSTETETRWLKLSAKQKMDFRQSVQKSQHVTCGAIQGQPNLQNPWKQEESCMVAASRACWFNCSENS